MGGQQHHKKEKPTPFAFDFNLSRSQVLYWAAQVQHGNHINAWNLVLVWYLHDIATIWAAGRSLFRYHATEVHLGAADSKVAHDWRGEPLLKAHKYNDPNVAQSGWRALVQLTVCQCHAVRLSHCHIEIHHLMNLREWLKANWCSHGGQVRSPGMGC